MSTFALSPSTVTSFGSPPAIDSYTKSIDSTTTAATTTTTTTADRIQNFLLGSDWSSLSSLSPSTAPVPAAAAVVDKPASWSPVMADAPFVPSAVETVKPNMEAVPVATIPAALNSDFDFDVAMSASSPVATPPAAPHPSPLTPDHRNSFDPCYTDSAGSPNSDRDFLISPSLFDDADFEFEGDALANAILLFGDQAREDSTDANVEDPISTTASNLENVSLEAQAEPEPEPEPVPESQQTVTDFESSQATVMPSQSQVKVEDNDDHDHESLSSLVASFKTEEDPAKLEPKQEHDPWSAEELKPFLGDEESKAALLSSIINAAYEYNVTQPVKEVTGSQDAQRASNVGPVRRERHSSPTKARNMHYSASPAPIIDPITKAKRWQCDDCGKWFDRAFNLKTHRYTHEDPHTRARPFICPDVECQKQFARKHDMQRHFENVHRGESRRAKSGLLKRSRADDLG